MRKPFYGYWIVAATFLCNVMTFGCGFYAFSLFVSPLGSDLSWGRGDVMAGFTVFFLSTGLLSPQVGRLVDRHGARVVMSVGAVLAGIGFVVLSQMTALWQFYLGYMIVGVGMAGTGQIPTSAVVSNWFEKRRGTAVGVMASGIGVGGLAFPALLGERIIPLVGWSQCYLLLGVLLWAVIIPLSVFVIRTKPSEKGLVAYGAEGLSAHSEEKRAPVSGISLKLAMGTLSFWLIAATYFFSHFAQVGAVQNQVPFLEDTGFPMMVSAGALGAVGLCSAFGKFTFGWLCDRIQARHALAIGLGLQCASILVLMRITPDSAAASVWLYAVMMGFGLGSWLPTMSMLTSGYFGMAHYGAVFGALTIPYAVGSAIGPFVAGRMYDMSGNYDAVFILFLVLFAVAIVSILLARRPRTA
ncbi:MAG: MFS transporter [Dehalococcoidia bacterium]|nr:MFS transporter [Dehalococcoidia bacterium]